MIFDRDVIFSAGLTATIRSMLMEPTRTSYQNPWLNGVAERFVGTVRQELLVHVIVLNARHLRQLIESFATYYNADRTHIELGKDSPCVRPVEQRLGLTSNVVSLPRVGALHHRYAWRQAAQTVSGRRFLCSTPLGALAEGDRARSSRWRRPFSRRESRAGERFELRATSPIPFRMEPCSRNVLLRPTGVAHQPLGHILIPATTRPGHRLGQPRRHRAREEESEATQPARGDVQLTTWNWQDRMGGQRTGTSFLAPGAQHESPT